MLTVLDADICAWEIRIGPMLASLESPALWQEHLPRAKQLGNSDATLDEQHEEVAGLPCTREKLRDY